MNPFGAIPSDVGDEFPNRDVLQILLTLVILSILVGTATTIWVMRPNHNKEL